MAETQYEVMKAGTPKVPPINLIKITGPRNLVASLNAFGPNYFNSNVTEMKKQYSHPQTGEIISLREPTTAESVLIASYNFAKRAKPKIFNPRWLQTGRTVRTSEGVYMNPPKDSEGNPIIDEKTLKSYLKSSNKVNGIWLLDNDFGYAPYGTFKQGVQDSGDFAESGLAKVIEHSENPEKLKEISSKTNYPDGVNVWGFDAVNQQVLRVVTLWIPVGTAGSWRSMASAGMATTTALLLGC
jgi:hypothetical protein